MNKGKVKFFKGGQGKGSGFGFITKLDEQGQAIVKSKGTGKGGADETDDYFVHINNVEGREELFENDLVNFDLEPGKEGKGEAAVNVVITQRAS